MDSGAHLPGLPSAVPLPLLVPFGQRHNPGARAPGQQLVAAEAVSPGVSPPPACVSSVKWGVGC